MEFLTTVVESLNSLSPLAVIGLLGIVIYMLVRNKKDSDAQNSMLTSNHLHEMPEMAESLRRIEQSLAENFSYIRARLNGGK